MPFGKPHPFNETILDTIEWGKTYRYEKDQLRRDSILPAASPLDLQRLWHEYQRSKQLAEIKELQRKLAIKPNVQIVVTQRIVPGAVSKKEYYNYMSTPRRINRPKPPAPPPVIPKWLLKKPKKECSPHINNLALPTKVRVYHTWKDHGESLPMEVLARLENLLNNTDQNVEPQFASCYFKLLDRRKRKGRKKILNKCRKKLRQKLKNEQKEWLAGQINTTVDLIVRFLEKESLFAVNFKQMMISETILNKLHEQGDLDYRPSRNTSRPFGRCMVDIADQVAVWIDTIVRYIDAQYTESITEMQNLSIESLSWSDLEEEEEGDANKEKWGWMDGGAVEREGLETTLYKKPS